jgi:thiol-disulfide isomerase/thioredoxin
MVEEVEREGGRSRLRKILAVALELASGLPLVLVGILGIFILLQSRPLAYLFFPSLCLVAAALGIWRGRKSDLPSWQIVALLNLPLVLVILWSISQRNRALVVLPLFGTVFSALGAAADRRHRAASIGRAWLTVLPPIVGVNIVLALGIPWFASSFILSREVKEPARDFRLALLDGRTVSAQQLRGRVVVLDYWATWCVPCRRELPYLERVQERFSKLPDVVFYAVSYPKGDTPGDQGDTPDQAQRFFRENGYRLALAFDTAGEVNEVFSVSRLPTLLILDRSGGVRFRHAGFIGSEDFVGTVSSVIEKLLHERSG